MQKRTEKAKTRRKQRQKVTESHPRQATAGEETRPEPAAIVPTATPQPPPRSMEVDLVRASRTAKDTRPEWVIKGTDAPKPQQREKKPRRPRRPPPARQPLPLQTKAHVFAATFTEARILQKNQRRELLRLIVDARSVDWQDKESSAVIAVRLLHWLCHADNSTRFRRETQDTDRRRHGLTDAVAFLLRDGRLIGCEPRKAAENAVDEALKRKWIEDDGHGFVSVTSTGVGRLARPAGTAPAAIAECATVLGSKERGPAKSKMEAALGCLATNHRWTTKRIAENVGIRPDTLYKNEIWKKARAVQRPTPRRAFRDPRTGNLDVSDEDV